MKVIEARTSKNYKATRAILDIDLSKDSWYEDCELARNIILKQSKADMRQRKAQELKAKAEYNKKPSNFYRFNMEMRKCVTKQDDEVVITSLVESTVGVRDFTGGKFFGCEFVRAVTGFHCRLCSLNIREAKGVLQHIQSNCHKSNYARYLVNNPDYEKMQNVQNKDLDDIMVQHEGKSVVLAESKGAESSRFLSSLDNDFVRIPNVMNPGIKKREAEEKAEADAAEAAAQSEAKSNVEEEGDNIEAKQDEEMAEAEVDNGTNGEGIAEDGTEEENVGNEESEGVTNSIENDIVEDDVENDNVGDDAKTGNVEGDVENDEGDVENDNVDGDVEKNNVEGDVENEKAEDNVGETEELLEDESAAEKDQQVVTEKAVVESDAEATEELTFSEDAGIAQDVTTEEISRPQSAKGKGKKGGGKGKGK